MKLTRCTQRNSTQTLQPKSFSSRARALPSSSTCNRSLFLLSDISSNTWCAAPRGRTSNSKGSHQQLQGTSKVISMASRGSCDPIDPTVAPPLVSGHKKQLELGTSLVNT